MREEFKKAIEVLKQGGIVIFPTDTAFGIGCRIDNEKAVKRLFELRKRPENQAAPVLFDTVKMVRNYVELIPQEVIDNLIEPYWPGALTIVLQSKTEKAPSLIRGGGNTIGVRIPNHPVPRSLIRELGVPILGPSANFHGEKTPFRPEDLNPKLIQLVDYVIPGKCSCCQQSTVIDCTQKPWKVLRQGAIRIQNLEFRVKNNSESGDKIVLKIDSSSNKEIKVGLNIDDKEQVLKREIGEQKAQVVLTMIEEILKRNLLKLVDIKEIEVNTGPGSFTGLRVGVAVANALGFALNISVNGQRAGKFVEPIYE